MCAGNANRAICSAALGQGNQAKPASFDLTAKRAINRKRRSRRAQLMLLLDERTSSRAAFVLHVALWGLIITSVIVIVIQSSPRLSKSRTDALFWIDFALDVCFTIELAVRVGATANLHLLVSDPFVYADVLAIIPFVVFIFTCAVEQEFEKPGRTSTDRMESLQVLKLVRILKLARHFEGARVLWLALQASREALMVPLYFLFTMILLFGALLYIAGARAPRGTPGAARLGAPHTQRTRSAPSPQTAAAPPTCVHASPAHSVPPRRATAPLLRDNRGPIGLRLDHGLRMVCPCDADDCRLRRSVSADVGRAGHHLVCNRVRRTVHGDAADDRWQQLCRRLVGEGGDTRCPQDAGNAACAARAARARAHYMHAHA